MAKSAILTDNFNDNLTDATKWPNAFSSAATYAETGGELVITLAASTAGTQSAGYSTSPNTYDLTSSYILTKIPTAPTGTFCRTRLYALVDASNYFGFQIAGTSLQPFKVIAGATSVFGGTTYNATNHKWLRIRESGGTTFWDTSPDGITWTNLTSAANPLTETALVLAIESATIASQASPGTAHFDNFNAAPQTITTTGIGSALSIGNPTVKGRSTISPSGIASTSAVGVPTVRSGPVTVSPAGIVSGAAFGVLDIYIPPRPSTPWTPDGINATGWTPVAETGQPSWNVR